MLKQQFASRFRLAKLGVAAVVAGLAVSGAMAQTSSMIVTETGNVGLGLDAPLRQLHIQGRNAAMRMDRDVNGTGFILTRTAENDFSAIWKTYSFAARATGVNNGEFVINDLGTAVEGGGTRRLTIANNGNVTLGVPGSPTASITATAFLTSSSLRFKSGVETLANAEDGLSKLRGVKYVQVADGKESVGLVAEEVVKVYPQLVERNAESGQVDAVNYPALVAVLIEGYKAQQKRINAQAKELDALRGQVSAIELLVAGQAARQVTALKP